MDGWVELLYAEQCSRFYSNRPSWQRNNGMASTWLDWNLLISLYIIDDIVNPSLLMKKEKDNQTKSTEILFLPACWLVFVWVLHQIERYVGWWSLFASERCSGWELGKKSFKCWEVLLRVPWWSLLSHIHVLGP